jgi:hypothetical protein
MIHFFSQFNIYLILYYMYLFYYVLHVFIWLCITCIYLIMYYMYLFDFVLHVFIWLCITCIYFLCKLSSLYFCKLFMRNKDIYVYCGTCLIRHNKGPGKCVRLQRKSEYSGFILVNRSTWDHTFLSDVTGCRKTQVSDCTSSTVYNNLEIMTL